MFGQLEHQNRNSRLSRRFYWYVEIKPLSSIRMLAAVSTLGTANFGGIMKDASLDKRLLELLEDFSQRQRAGERPKIEEYQERYPELASQIGDLFPAVAMVEGFATSPPGDGNADQQLDSVRNVPLEFSDFRLLKEIARGGMGVVYLAEQRSLNRQVALKVLPSGLANNKSARERFHLEARAAASLNHPNIVPIFAVGTEGQCDYYAMRYIEGSTIAQLLDRRSKTDRRAELSLDADQTADEVEYLSYLSIKTTLAQAATTIGSKNLVTNSHPANCLDEKEVAELGRTIADALHVAHVNGIVHRDVKPSNILIDREGKPYLADFGLAFVEKNLELTKPGMVLGSLPYMSPEQHDPDVAIDHRADQFGLGATMYEMLTGHRALAGKNRMLIAKQVASGSILPLRKINPMLSRDIETIVHKAMQTDPADRYRSMADLRDDLTNFLECRPINACRVSNWRRFQQWQKRNPVVAGLTGMVAALIVTTAIVASLMAWRLNRIANERSLALADATESRTRAEKLARRESVARSDEELARRRAERTEKFLVRALRSPSLDFDGKQVTIYQVLKRTLGEIDEELGDEPELKHQVLLSVWDAFAGLDQYDDALEVIERADKLATETHGPQHSRTLNTRHLRGNTLLQLGRQAEARELLEQTLNDCRRFLGAEDLLTLQVADKLAMTLFQLGDEPAGVKLHEQNYEIAAEVLGPAHLFTLQTLNNLAAQYQTQQMADKAIPLLEEVWEARKLHLGEYKPGTLLSKVNLGGACRDAKQLDRACTLLVEALDDCEGSLGTDHTTTILCKNNLAMVQADLGRYDVAIKNLRQVESARTKKLGPDHPSVFRAQANLGNVLLMTDHVVEGLSFLEMARNNCRRILGGDHWRTLALSSRLANRYQKSGQIDKAIGIMEEALADKTEQHGEDHLEVSIAKVNFAAILCQEGYADRALELFRSGVDFTVTRYGVQSAQARNMYRWIHTCLMATGDWQSARDNLKLWNDCLELDKTIPPSERLWYLADLAWVKLKLDLVEESETAIRAANDLIQKDVPASFWPDWMKSTEGLILANRGDVEAAEQMLLDSCESLLRQEKAMPKHHRFRCPQAIQNIIQFYTEFLPDSDKRASWEQRLERLNATRTKG